MAGGTLISTEDPGDVELELELGNLTLKECKRNNALSRCLGGPIWQEQRASAREIMVVLEIWLQMP